MPPNAPTVLAIEDEAQIRRFLRATLGSEGYTLLEAETGEQALTEAASYPPDLILLDLGLPDMDGLEVIRRLRQWTSVPVIIISARGQEQDKVAALDAGADDYLTKPFGVAELMARIRVALRHANRTEDESAVFESGDLKVDLARRLVFVGGQEVHLTPIEFKLLALLAKHAGKVLTHRQVLKEVWGPNYADDSHYLRVFVHQLRHKIEADPAQPKHLITEAGVGYRLRAQT
ncbi:MAG: response regulator [Planctomycetota bacterium]|nr:response regulator [Planctomycetota bacterium]